MYDGDPDLIRTAFKEHKKYQHLWICLKSLGIVVPILSLSISLTPAPSPFLLFSRI